MPVIELRDVTRRFGDLTAVDQVTLDVAQGEIVGLLGHNGAGKTTLLRVINGLLPPDHGTVTVHGFDPAVAGDQVRRNTGVLTEYPALEGYLSTRENLEVYAAVNGVKPAEAGPRIDVLMERLGLAGKEREPARALSAGLKQRVALARALVHEPALLLLDEPTTNMDPLAAREVRSLITGAVRELGRTVLLCTHNLPEAEELCDRVAIMRDGRILLEGEPGQLRRTLGAAEAVRITTDPDAVARMTEVLSPRWHVTGVDATTVHVTATGPDEPRGSAATDRARDRAGMTGLEVPEIVAAAVAAQLPVHRVQPVEPSLEDLYVALHSEEARG